jgi:hypothetical protein
MPFAPFLPWREDHGLLVQPAEVVRYRLAATRLLKEGVSRTGERWQEATTIEFQQCRTGRRPFTRRSVAIVRLAIGIPVDQEVVGLIRLATLAAAVAFGVPVVQLC